MSISGLFELEPLVSTSLNARLGLDAAEARRLSPLFWPPPAGRTMIAYVGGAESSEFLRQSRTVVASKTSGSSGRKPNGSGARRSGTARCVRFAKRRSPM
jgi:hypothetical protein